MTLVGNNDEDLISLSHYYRDTLVTFPPADSAPASQSRMLYRSTARGLHDSTVATAFCVLSALNQ